MTAQANDPSWVVQFGQIFGAGPGSEISAGFSHSLCFPIHRFTPSVGFFHSPAHLTPTARKMGGMENWYAIENENEIPTPTVLVYPQRIRHNLETMVGWNRKIGALGIRPHVKTHKLPQVIRLKIECGIQKFKASTIAEAEMTATAGGKDVLIAMQPVGPHADRLIQLQKAYPDTKFSTIVDDESVIDRLQRLASAHQVTVPVFLDLNVGMNRTGVDASSGAFELYKQVANQPSLSAEGLHVYDGHLHEQDENALLEKVKATFEDVWKLYDRLQSAGHDVPCIVGCGTPTSRLILTLSDEFPEVPFEVSAGTTVLWDAGQSKFTPELSMQNAAVLLTRVVSRPGSELLTLDLGHKSVASEMPHPRVQLFGLEGAEFVSHNEEHLVVRMSDANRYRVGDAIYGIPTHVCPTIALHDSVWCVENQRAHEQWKVTARDRRITI